MSSDSDARIPVALLAQVPPPVHGQAVANALLLCDYERIKIEHVPMAFSDSLDTVGRFQLHKLTRAWRLVRAARRLARNTPGAVLVYSVGMRNRVAVYRDTLVLLLTRPWFGRTVFHVHSGEPGKILRSAPPLVRRIAQRAYRDADIVVYLDRSLAGAGGLPRPRAVRYLPYGIEAPDDLATAATHRIPRRGPPTVLFLGNLYESKGTLDLVAAAGRLASKGIQLRVAMCGAAPDADTHRRLTEAIAAHGVADLVEVRGAVDTAAKWQALRDADVLCFPTRYEGEAMPLVVIEAMAAGLPVVSTRWRAVPALVDDGVTGALVDPGDVDGLVEVLGELLLDHELRGAMGVAARRRFEERHTVERYRADFEAILTDAFG